MGWPERAIVGKTPGAVEGSPSSRGLMHRSNMERLPATAPALAALAISVVACLMAAFGQARISAVADPPGGVVRSVVAGSAEWAVGIRPGDRVLSIRSSDEPGGWELAVSDGAATYGLNEQALSSELRADLPFAAIGLAASLLALVLAFGSRRRSEAAAVIGLASSSGALMLAGVGWIAASSAVGSLVIPGLVEARWLGRRLGLALLALTVAAAAVWLAAWVLEAPGLFDALAAVRTTLVVVMVALATAVLLDAATWLSRVTAGTFHLGDAVALVTGVAILVVGGLAGQPVAAVGLVLVGTAIYVVRRHSVRALVDALVLRDLREQAVVTGADRERVRRAGEIHDSTLPRLADVIRHLDVVPSAEDDAEQLRTVAAELRDAAVARQAPELEHFGLAVALEGVAERMSRAATIHFDVDVLALPGDRPPAAVEHAGLRVCEEAMANALKHSGGHLVTVRGKATREAVDLTVEDDGRGIPPDAVNRAAAAGRLGLRGMRARAVSVGAECTVTGGPEGTTVRFRWTAPSAF